MNLDEDVPPPGTACIVCRAMGHFCKADRYFLNSDDGICIPCFEKRNCPQTQVLNNHEERESEYLITEALKKDILSAPTTEDIYSIGRRTGIDPHYVARIRRQAGIAVPDPCVVNGCSNVAVKGYSYCAVSHSKELEVEKYDQIVAARRLLAKSKARSRPSRAKAKPEPPQVVMVTQPEVLRVEDVRAEAWETTNGQGKPDPIGNYVFGTTPVVEYYEKDPMDVAVAETEVVVLKPITLTVQAEKIDPFDIAIREIQTQIQKRKAEIEKMEAAIAVLEGLKCI